MYRQWAQADKDSRTLSYIFVGGIAAPVVVAGLVETGSTYYLYQGGSWLVRNYGVSFAEEVTKEFFANRFQWRKMDWGDIVVSTAASKFDFWGKAGAEMFNATNDLNVKYGWQNSFVPGRYNKDLRTTAIDGGFGILKVVTGRSLYTNFYDANIDQVQYELNKYLGPPH